MARQPSNAKEEDELDVVGPAPAPEPGGCLVRGAKLEPIRYVERELTRPDGTKLRARVPVYPPFRLEERTAPQATPAPAKRPPTQKKAS